MICVKTNPGAISINRNFFRENEGFMYKCTPRDKYQIVVTRTLIQTVIKESHDPIYVAHHCMKRIDDFISLNYWWPGMRRSI